MRCIQCEKELQRRPDGAWPRCCDGQGYIVELKPLPKDRWYPHKPHHFPNYKWWREKERD